MRVDQHPFRAHLDRPRLFSPISRPHHYLNSSNNSSILHDIKTSVTLRQLDIRDICNLTRDHHKGVKVLVITRPRVLEPVLIGRARIGAGGKVRLLFRRMRCIPLIIIILLQVLLLMVCYLFPVLKLMFCIYECITLIYIYDVCEHTWVRI